MLFWITCNVGGFAAAVRPCPDKPFGSLEIKGLENALSLRSLSYLVIVFTLSCLIPAEAVYIPKDGMQFLYIYIYIEHLPTNIQIQVTCETSFGTFECLQSFPLNGHCDSQGSDRDPAVGGPHQIEPIAPSALGKAEPERTSCASCSGKHQLI